MPVFRHFVCTKQANKMQGENYMKLHLKLTSVLLSAVMCASMVMAPVSVIADETSAPEETQTTEATEKEETKETEKKTPKATEKPEPKETKATEKTEPEEKKPSETVKETDPMETEDKKPAETEETEASKPEETKPSDAKKEEPAETSETEPTQTTKPDEEDAPETTVTPETGEKEETHRVPRKNAGTSIASVSITLDAPEAGAKPDYTAVFPSGADYYSDAYIDDVYRNNIYWYDIALDNSVNPDSGVFKAGHQYMVRIYLTAKDGYTFTNSTTATLNGQTAETYLSSGMLRVEYTFPKLEGEPNYISSVSITLDAPEVGAKPDYTAVFPSGANYYSDAYTDDYHRNHISWYDITSGNYVNPDSGVFRAGHQYRVVIDLTAKDGDFTKSTTATLNGQTAGKALISGQLKVVYTFPALLKPISSVSVTLGLIDPSLCLGSHFPYDTYFPSDANYYSNANNAGNYRNDIAWYDVTTESYGNPDSGTYSAGHQYKVIVYLTAKDGYSFTNNTTATLNDRFTAEATLDGERLKVTYTFSPVKGESVDVINYVSCTIDAPAIGSNLDFNAEFPTGSKYGKITNSVIWHDITTNADLSSSSLVFECGHQYQVRIDAYADEGYYFTDSTTATLNGQSAEVQKLSKSKICISYTFPKLGSNIGDIETVDNVNYKVTNANTDGTGTVTLIGMAVKRASVSIPATVEINGFTYIVNRIGTKAFYGDKTIKTVYIGNNIAIIDASAFYGCSNLTKVSGGKVLKTIGSSAFAKCSKLKSFSIASTVLSKIGTYTFNKDSKLKTIYIKYTTKLTKSGVKKSLKGSKVKTVKVKKSKVKKYKKYFKKKNSGRSVKVKK